jgi:hypothetical protein
MSEVGTNQVVDRGIGPEKLSVRIFREIFTKSALKNGNLKADLDEYLKQVLSNDGAKRTDKTYARKIYLDLVRLAGGTGLPDWAKRQVEAEKPLTDAGITEMLTGIAPEPPVAVLQVRSDGLQLDTSDNYIDPNEISLEDPADVFLQGNSAKEQDPFTADDGPLKPLMAEYIAKTTHPFVRHFQLEGRDYVAVGTFVGNIVKGEHAGKKINVNFTVNPYRGRRDIPDDILVTLGGRAVTMINEDERECRRFLFVLRHKSGMKLRFWTSVGGKDLPGGARYAILTPVLTSEAKGWKEVTRAEF